MNRETGSYFLSVINLRQAASPRCIEITRHGEELTNSDEGISRRRNIEISIYRLKQSNNVYCTAE